jgi:hypothetical protein
MKSYWKSQWPNIIFGLINTGISLWNFCSEEYLWGVAWMLSAMTWLIMSRVDYNEERIKELEKEVRQLKDRAITDVDTEDFPKIHFRHGLRTKKEDQ